MSTDLLAVLVAAAVLWWITPSLWKPDGLTYLRRASGQPVAPPFAWRLWPALLQWGVSGHREADGELSVRIRPVLAGGLEVVRWGSVVVSALVLLRLAGPVAALLWLGLPIARVQGSWRWTTDSVGHACALACLVAPPWAQVPLGLAAGLTSERAPVFAALFAWSPLPLVGLVIPFGGWLWARRGPAAEYERAIISRPLGSAIEYARSAGAARYLLPWGVCLGALPWLGWHGWLVTAVAYGQCLVAVDRARLYQWAAPAWCVALALAVGDWPWWPVLVAVHWALPWRQATEGCEQ